SGSAAGRSRGVFSTTISPRWRSRRRPGRTNSRTFSQPPSHARTLVIMALHVYVDADACPVKEETYRVAGRYGLCVTLVAGSWMRIPSEPNLSLEVVDQGFDAADDWIV